MTRVCGRPTLKCVAKTRKEMSAYYARAKTSHTMFPMGSKFGFAAAVLKAQTYTSLHNSVAASILDAEELDKAWEFTYPVRPLLYNNTALPGGLNATKRNQRRRKQEAENADQIVQFDVFEAHETDFKGQLEDTYDESYLEALKDDVLGFTHVTVVDMLVHLTEQSLSLTTVEKKKNSNRLI